MAMPPIRYVPASDALAIALDLVISRNTVDRHLNHIYTKAGLSNRAQAASYAVRNGLA